MLFFAQVLQPALTAARENWRMMSPRKLAFLDGLLLNLLFLAIHFFVTGSLRLPAAHIKLLLLLNGAWLFFSTLEHKFSLRHIHSFAELAFKLVQITLLMLLAVSLTLTIQGARDFNRLYILGTFAGLLLAELFIVGLYYPRVYASMQRAADEAPARMRYPYSIPLIFLDLLLFILLFLFVYFFKYRTFELELRHWQLLGIMAGMWVLSAKWTGKFEKRNHPSFYHAYEPFLKATFILAASAALLLYSFHIFNYSRTILFAPVALLPLLEAPAVLIWHRVRSVENPTDQEDIESIQGIRRFLEETALEVSAAASFSESARGKLSEYLSAGHPALHALIERRCKLDSIAVDGLEVMDTRTSFNVRTLENQSLQMFVNLHRVNDFRRLNYYFLEVHQKLVKGGYFIGLMDTVDAAMLRLQKKYPKYMAYALYGLDFFWRRMMPKIPGLNKIYFSISRGRRRLFSKAELLGRLYFCGFRVLAAENHEGQLYYVAQKDKKLKHAQDPSYGMLIRLPRVGFQGRPILLYKLRTMHPYSEFIQAYVYNHHKLDNGGKLKDDFRVAAWGRLLRKLWLDELPQLINWMHGDLKIVGARALSPHYFSLYPEDLQALRIQFKPGLIPPYYADLPQSLEEIQESERRYFAAKLAHPFKTDWIYFFKAMYNILVKRARSK